LYVVLTMPTLNKTYLFIYLCRSANRRDWEKKNNDNIFFVKSTENDY
jgi:hypothetical protein